MQDNPAVLNNAGQLAAWYDNEVPKVSDAARRWLEQMRPKLAKKTEYAQAYARVARACKQRVALQAEYDKKLPPAEASAMALKRQLAQVNSQYRSVANEIDSRNRLINSLERELRYYHWYHRSEYGDYYYYYRRRRREELRDRIRNEEQAVDQLRRQAYRIRAEAELLSAELGVREKALAALRAERDEALGRVYRRFRWDPPAVDGVITPEVEHFVHARPKRATVSEDPEVLADKRLKVARMYIRHQLPEKALEILTELITRYGSTKAARHARVLLEQMQDER